VEQSSGRHRSHQQHQQHQHHQQQLQVCSHNLALVALLLPSAPLQAQQQARQQQQGTPRRSSQHPRT
jgi:hypothetical protein